MEGVRVEKVSRAAGIWTVRTDAGEFQAPVLVNTAGAWGDRISAQMGEEVPMETIAPMLMVTARMPPIIRGVMGATDRILSIKQRSATCVTILENSLHLRHDTDGF